MFKTTQGPDGPMIPEKVLTIARLMTDDWWDLSLAHSNKHGSIPCERTAFIGYLTEAMHCAMYDIFDKTSSFYELCKSNDDNIIGKDVTLKEDVLTVNFNLFNSLGLDIPYATQRAGDFCWEVFENISVIQLEKHLWNINLIFDGDLISDQIERMSKYSSGD